MKWEILIIGRGGQGILLLGRILGLAASKYAGLYAVFTESYAAETRGGESRSDVIIANTVEEIDYIKVQRPDIAVFMYPYNLDKYKAMLKPHSMVFIDDEYVDPGIFKEHIVFSHKFSEIAEKQAGSRRVANMVLLGKLIKETKILSIDHVKKTLEELIHPNWFEINIKALETGYNL
ncbi:MAG: 2-oxoacid:acceptor oxidoreductase family protein [Desulfurococcaceae archaeon]